MRWLTSPYRKSEEHFDLGRLAQRRHLAVEQVARLLARQPLLDLRPRLLEGDAAGGPLVLQPHHVEAERGLDDAAGLAGLEPERRRLERRHVLAAGEPGQQAALAARLGVVGALAGDLGEVLATLDAG